MSTKGKRMADNSGKEGDISPEKYKYGAYERNKEREEENAQIYKGDQSGACVWHCGKCSISGNESCGR